MLSRNQILEKYLGPGNTGPKILDQSEQFNVFYQILSHLIKTTPNLRDAVVSRYAHTPCLGTFMQTEQGSQYFGDDQIKNYAKAEGLDLSASADNIALHYFSLRSRDLFGYEFPNMAHKPFPDQTRYYNLQAVNYIENLPFFLQLNNDQWKIKFALQYSESDGDFLAGEVFYAKNDSNDYFPINLCYSQHLDDNPYSIKDINPGYKFDKALLLNANKIIDNKDKPIVIFHDKVVANNINTLSCSLPFIPSAYNFHFSLNNIYLDNLKYRDIVLFPLPDINSYRSILNLARIITKLPAKSVQIANYSILYFPITSNLVDLHKEELAIQHIVNNSKLLSNIEINSFLSENEKILNIDKYEYWLQEIAIYSDEKRKDNNLASSISTLNEYKQRDYSQILIHEFFRPNTLSFCYGESTAGKSMWALSLALSFSCGFDLFHMTSNNKKSVLYIDYESDPQSFEFNLHQIINAYNLEYSLIENNFKFILRKSGKKVETLFNTEGATSYLSELKKYIFKNGIKLVIVDTMTNAAHDAYSSVNRAATFFDTINNICNELDTAFLFIHHSNENGQMDGSSRLFKDADNVIKLIKNFDNDLDNPGLCFDMCILKSKIYPNFINKKWRFSLEFPSNIKDSSRWVEIDNNNKFLSNNKNKINFDFDDETCNAIAQILLSNNDGLSANDIKNILRLDISKKTITNKIRLINERNGPIRIIKLGSGPTTKWKINSGAEDGGQPQLAASEYG